MSVKVNSTTNQNYLQQKTNEQTQKNNTEISIFPLEQTVPEPTGTSTRREGAQLVGKLEAGWNYVANLYSNIVNKNNFTQEQLAKYDTVIKDTLIEKCNNVIVDYVAPEGATDDEKMAALKAHYQDLATKYVAYFDNNGNNQIEYAELLEKELLNFLASQYDSSATNLSEQEIAEIYQNAQEYISNLDLLNLLQRASNNENLSSMDLLSLGVLEKFDLLNMDTNGELVLTNKETQRYFAAMSQYSGDQNPNITAGEYFVFEDDVINNKVNVTNWLEAAGEYFGIE